MTIFGVLHLEKTVQENDKTRLDVSQSFASSDEADIILVEVEPFGSNGFIDVTTDLFLDWAYAADGTKTVSVRITTDGAPTTATKDLLVITEDAMCVSQDLAMSSSAQLQPYHIIMEFQIFPILDINQSK